MAEHDEGVTPVVSADPVKRKLAAILSADAVGYSRLMTGDETATLNTLNAHRRLMDGLIRHHGGRVVDAVGDNLLAEFPSVVNAVACAVAVQEALAEQNTDLPVDRRMPFRIGIHLGDVVVEGEQVYGDGGNIAARLEALADSGGICISGTVYEQVRGKLLHRYEDRGEQSLKNIAHTVRVYRVRAAEGEKVGVAAKQTIPGFADRPAIAVLAFDNLSGDPEQEYFADGIAEDLITRLSSWKSFPVIARNSSFVYKGAPVDIKRVREELGAGYVVEGSVRKAQDRVRISAQLIDAETGHHVWAQNYDRELADIFALQDEISCAIAVSTSYELDRVEIERSRRLDPNDIGAWDLLQQARWYFAHFTADDNARARELSERAVGLDPYFAAAFSLIAATHYFDFFNDWTDELRESSEALRRNARTAVELDPGDAVGRVMLASAFSLTGEADSMLAAAERAVELNPSMPMAQVTLGFALAGRGRVDESVATLKMALRLSPRDPYRWLAYDTLAFAYYSGARYDEALAAGRRTLELHPTYVFGHLLLAVCYGALGRDDDGRTALAEALRLQPNLSPEFLKQNLGFAGPEFIDRYVADLCRVGWKEGEQG